MGDRLSSKRLSVLLTGIVGAISIATGIANIASGEVAVIGPLRPYVPEIVRVAAGFTGTITGFVMLLAAFALRGNYRAGWWLAIVLLPVTAAQGLIQSSLLSLPLVVFSLLSMPTLLLSRKRFQAPVSLTATQLAAGLSLGSVMIYGTVGGYALRDEFDGIDSLLDAFYFTLVTSSTVGYGDVTGQTEVARLFTLTVLVFGTASFAVALGALLGPLIERRFAAAVGRARSKEFELLEDHVLVLGHGDLTQAIIDELQGRHSFALVTRQQDVADDLRERDVLTEVGDPSDEATLDRVKIQDAAVAIVATDNDANDAFSVLTARQQNPDLKIVAAATNLENVTKLERAGATTVLSPATIGGTLLAGTTRPVGEETAEDRE